MYTGRQTVDKQYMYKCVHIIVQYEYMHMQSDGRLPVHVTVCTLCCTVCIYVQAVRRWISSTCVSVYTLLYSMCMCTGKQTVDKQCMYKCVHIIVQYVYVHMQSDG